MGVHEVDAFSLLYAQVATLLKHIGSLIANVIHTPYEVCVLCNGLHSST